MENANYFVFIHYYFLILTLGHFYIAFREKGSEGQRKRLMQERNISWLLLYVPWQGSNPQPGYVSWPRIEPMTIQSTGQCSNKLSHAGQAKLFLFFKKCWLTHAKFIAWMMYALQNSFLWMYFQIHTHTDIIFAYSRSVYNIHVLPSQTNSLKDAVLNKY